MRPAPHGRQGFFAAFRTAGAGLRDFSRERNSRVQLSAGVLAALMGVVLRIDRVEWAILTVTMTGVLGLEAMNCAVERVVDLASPGLHELARQAKDLAAGAVLIASIGAVLIGALVFGPHLWALWRS